MRTWRALYGNIGMIRAICDQCGGTALVQDGRTACCEAPVTDMPLQVKRECAPEGVRRLPSLRVRRASLGAQLDRCFYCRRRFGDVVYRLKRPPQRLRVEWDHLIPFVLTQNNYPHNFVAACHVCNRYKAARVFHHVDDAQLYLLAAWARSGYSDVPVVRPAVCGDPYLATVLHGEMPHASMGTRASARENERSPMTLAHESEDS